MKSRSTPKRSRAPFRGAYRPDAAAAIARIEAKRCRMQVSLSLLAARAGVSERTLRRIYRDGRAWPRHVKALRYALRSIERERSLEEGVLNDAD
ncbi:MAG: hypothetical protein RLO21_13750 [Nitratireductor sp.]